MKLRYLVCVAMMAACGDVQIDHPGTPCASPAQCDDLNACSVDTCEGGRCVHSPAPDGDRPTQTPGDCMKLVCKGGLEASMIDPTDTEADSNDCTVDTCHPDGTTAHLAAPPQTTCMLGGASGFCDGFGICKANDCLGPLPSCDDLNPCTADTCDVATGQCAFTPLNAGVPCMTGGGKVCDGAGICVECNVDADCPSPQTCAGDPKKCK